MGVDRGRDAGRRAPDVRHGDTSFVEQLNDDLDGRVERGPGLAVDVHLGPALSKDTSLGIRDGHRQVVVAEVDGDHVPSGRARHEQRRRASAPGAASTRRDEVLLDDAFVEKLLDDGCDSAARQAGRLAEVGPGEGRARADQRRHLFLGAVPTARRGLLGLHVRTLGTKIGS